MENHKRIRFCLILVPLICHGLVSAASDPDLGQPTLITGLNGVVNSLTISPNGNTLPAGADQMRAYATESLHPLSPVMDGTTNRRGMNISGPRDD